MKPAIFQELRASMYGWYNRTFYMLFPSIFPVEIVLVDESSHQFYNGKCRMSIIDLNGNFLMKIIKCIMFFAVASDNIPDCAGNKKIFLYQTEFFPGLDQI